MPSKFIPKFGLGCVNLTRENSAIVDVAIAAGIALFDTADCYGNNESEIALGEKLKSYKRDNLFISSKVGVQITADGMKVHGDKAYIKAACEASLQRMQLDYLDLLYLHRSDPAVPIETSMQALRDLVHLGKIKQVGLSEVTADQIQRAHKIHPVSVVQIEYAPWSRQEENNHVIDVCRKLGIAVVAYSPLGRGFFTSNDKAYFEKLPDNDFRHMLPRYNGSELSSNMVERNKFDAIAKDNNCTLAQLILAWELAKGFTCIPGTTNSAHLNEDIAALKIKLPPAEVDKIDKALIASHYQGQRYPSREVSAIFPAAPMTLFQRAHNMLIQLKPCHGNDNSVRLDSL